MLRRSALAAPLALILAACAGGPPPEPPAPPPLDPAGTYDITVEAQGMSIVGVMFIEGSEAEGWTGSIDSDMGSAALSGITVMGDEVTFQIPDAGVQARLLFEGRDSFTGGITGAMGDALMFGTRRAGS